MLINIFLWFDHVLCFDTGEVYRTTSRLIQFSIITRILSIQYIFSHQPTSKMVISLELMSSARILAKTT